MDIFKKGTISKKYYIFKENFTFTLSSGFA